jgi:hypothetical protein
VTLLQRYRVFAAKTEATSGTAETLTSAESGYEAYDILAQQGIGMQEREAEAGFGRRSSITDGYQGTIAFKTDVNWDGTSTLPKWATVLLPACGVVNNSGLFTPRTEVPGSNVKTVTLGCYVGSGTSSVLKLLRGCAGTFKLVCPTGKAAYIEWNFTGIWQAPTAATFITSGELDGTNLRYANGATTWDSVALCLENITLDVGNEVVLRECATTVSGYHAAMVVDRVPKVTGNPEAKLIATQDRYGQFLAMTEASLVWEIKGPSTSKIVITAPQAQILNIQEGARNKIVTDEIEWQCNRDGDDLDQEFSIEFQEAA